MSIKSINDPSLAVQDSHFSRIPIELVTKHIFGLLEIKYLPSIALVCKLFSQYVQNNATWELYHENHWKIQAWVHPSPLPLRIRCQRAENASHQTTNAIDKSLIFWRLGCVEYDQEISESNLYFFRRMCGDDIKETLLFERDGSMTCLLGKIHAEEDEGLIEIYRDQRAAFIKRSPCIGAWISHLVNTCIKSKNREASLNKEDLIMFPKKIDTRWEEFASLIEGAILLWIRLKKENMAQTSFHCYCKSIEVCFQKEPLEELNLEPFFLRVCEELTYSPCSGSTWLAIFDRMLKFQCPSQKWKMIEIFLKHLSLKNHSLLQKQVFRKLISFMASEPSSQNLHLSELKIATMLAASACHLGNERCKEEWLLFAQIIQKYHLKSHYLLITRIIEDQFIFKGRYYSNWKLIYSIQIDLLKKTLRNDDAIFIWGKALKFYDTSHLDQDVSSTCAFFDLGWHLIEKSREVRSVLLNEEFPNHPCLSLAISYVCYCEGDISNAHRILNEIIETLPPFALDKASDLCLLLHRPKKAFEIWDQIGNQFFSQNCVDNFPRNPSSFFEKWYNLIEKSEDIQNELMQLPLPQPLHRLVGMVHITILNQDDKSLKLFLNAIVSHHPFSMTTEAKELRKGVLALELAYYQTLMDPILIEEAFEDLLDSHREERFLIYLTHAQKMTAIESFEEGLNILSFALEIEPTDEYALSLKKEWALALENT